MPRRGAECRVGDLSGAPEEFAEPAAEVRPAAAPPEAAPTAPSDNAAIVQPEIEPSLASGRIGSEAGPTDGQAASTRRLDRAIGRGGSRATCRVSSDVGFVSSARDPVRCTYPGRGAGDVKWGG